MSYVVHVGHDVGQGVYYVLSSDIPGLNVEAPSIEQLMEITRDVAPDLLGEPAAGSSISFQHEVVFVA